MDKELNAIFYPHPWLPLPRMRNQDQFEVNPVGLDALIHSRIRFHPIAINVSRIGFLRAEAAVNVDLLYPSCPKRLDRCAEFPSATTGDEV